MKGANFVSKLIFSYAFSSIQDGNPIIAKYKAVVGSKVKSITKDIEGAMGLGEDEDKESEAAAELESMKVDEEFRRK